MVTPLKGKMEETQFGYFGFIGGMQEDMIGIKEYEVKSSERRGRPRCTCQKEVKSYDDFWGG